MTPHYPIRIVHVVTGDELAVLRRRLTLTQVAFAGLLGVHANTVARYERNELSIPEPVARLAHVLAETGKKPTRRRR